MPPEPAITPSTHRAPQPSLGQHSARRVAERRDAGLDPAYRYFCAGEYLLEDQEQQDRQQQRAEDGMQDDAVDHRMLAGRSAMHEAKPARPFEPIVSASPSSVWCARPS